MRSAVISQQKAWDDLEFGVLERYVLVALPLDRAKTDLARVFQDDIFKGE